MDDTITFLRSLGVKNIDRDRLRSFGRGSSITESDRGQSVLGELCGSCWQGSACVFPDGEVATCIMARNWSIGSVLHSDCHDLIHSQALRDSRMQIYREVWLPQFEHEDSWYRAVHNGLANCPPECNPNCVPRCNPQCSPSCSPCYPAGKCDPALFCGPCGPAKKIAV